jgi:hypothetical protein
VTSHLLSVIFLQLYGKIEYKVFNAISVVNTEIVGKMVLSVQESVAVLNVSASA